ncbi:hypothetical protein [Ketobacter sp.]
METATQKNATNNRIQLVDATSSVALFNPPSALPSSTPGIVADQIEHWHDPVPNEFTAAQRASTTILFAGLTAAHDFFIQSAFTGAGYNVIALDIPDNKALQVGREYGNRGQCNPTYFTVGNLVKYLIGLRNSGIPKEEIIEKYLFATIGSCGPCRFGTYVTEYRKALRDAGFDGFRVIMFEQTKGIKQAAGGDQGLDLGLSFVLNMGKGIVAGDVINALAYRIRPYEVEPGATDRALQNSKNFISEALRSNSGFVKSLRKAKAEFSAIKVDRSKVKPKVSIIGEFWAMTTEGDGNYHLQRFLEQEGAEVEVQPVTAWVQYLLWQARYDTLDRSGLRGVDKGGDGGSKFALEGVSVRKRLAMIKLGEKALPMMFKTVARFMGLKGYKLSDMDKIAKVAHDYYDNNLRGGEGHMEVGKLILNVKDKKSDMTISVKPFGCMPSSGVSDGVQSIITERYPDAIFLPIETSGDGAVNVQSRVQMQLFKARKLVEAQAQALLVKAKVDPDNFYKRLSTSRANHPLHHSPHVSGCTAINVIHEVAGV